jgi:SH3-like domain-containing protein
MHFKAPTFDVKPISAISALSRSAHTTRQLMKRALAPIFSSAFVVAFAFAFTLPLPEAQAADMISVDVPTLNMRDGAGTNHTILWELSRGYPLSVVKKNGSWLKVRDFENDEGWVYRPHTGKKPHHIVKSKVANIRSGPGTKYRVVSKASRGDLFETVEKRADWIKVKDETGVKGWISRNLLWGW